MSEDSMPVISKNANLEFRLSRLFKSSFMISSITRRISSSVLLQNTFTRHPIFSGLNVAISFFHSQPFVVRSQLVSSTSLSPDRQPGTTYALWDDLRIRAKTVEVKTDVSVDQRWQEQSGRALKNGVVPANAYAGPHIPACAEAYV
jgi:hypothetical protein